MTEPQKTEEEIKAEAEAEAAAKAAAEAEPAGGKDPESLRRALAKQAEEFRANEAKLQKQLASYESEKLKAKEAKMKEDGKLQELLAEKEKAISDMAATAAAVDRRLLEASAREQLRVLGMTDTLYLTGAIAGLPADATAESVPEWAKLIKADNEAAFVAPATPVRQASLPGGPAINAIDTASLEARLKDEDPKVRAAAFSEQLKKDLGEAL